ncbi:hypothetical protein VNI00_007507 [Paramarasmius palmivorus]|uniref:DUF6534 domain-containing protein n=1 Tax=Paramarasmius palmivorus TaxID=297713 RepID=A0AAW0D2H1_9AGAR
MYHWSTGKRSTTASAVLILAHLQLLSYLLNWGLFGILSVQVYLYYTAFPHDKKLFKILVYFIYLLEATQTVMLTHDSFTRFVYGFGNPEEMGRNSLLWFPVPFLDGLVAFLVQLQFAYRIHLLSPKSKLIVAFIVVIYEESQASLAQCGGAIAAALLSVAMNVDKLEDLVTNTTIVIFTHLWLVSGVIADVTIACSMSYALSRYDYGFGRTKDVVRRIIRLTMETGSATAILAICLLVLFLTGKVIYPNSYYFVPAAILAKVYSNSLMVIFNNRIQIAGRDSNNFDNSGDTVGGLALSTFRAHQQTEIRTQTETNVSRDPVPKNANHCISLM